MGRSFQSVLSKYKLEHRTSSVDTPSANGLVERMNRTVFTLANANLVHASLTCPFWEHSIYYAMWCLNRVSRWRNSTMSPYEALYGEVPNLAKARVFGCDVYVVTDTKGVMTGGSLVNGQEDDFVEIG